MLSFATLRLISGDSEAEQGHRALSAARWSDRNTIFPVLVLDKSVRFRGEMKKRNGAWPLRKNSEEEIEMAPDPMSIMSMNDDGPPDARDVFPGIRIPPSDKTSVLDHALRSVRVKELNSG